MPMKHCFSNYLPPDAMPILTLATIRALRLGSGRDDQALPTVLKTSSRDGLATPGLTQIVGMLKIQGQGAPLYLFIRAKRAMRFVQADLQPRNGPLPAPLLERCVHLH
jgi:hypothetical protein